MVILRRAGDGAHFGPFGTELTSVYVLSASTGRAQQALILSMGGLGGAKSSAAGGHAEMVHLAISPNLSRGQICVLQAIFASLVNV